MQSLPSRTFSPSRINPFVWTIKTQSSTLGHIVPPWLLAVWNPQSAKRKPKWPVPLHWTLSWGTTPFCLFETNTSLLPGVFAQRVSGAINLSSLLNQEKREVLIMVLKICVWLTLFILRLWFTIENHSHL